MFDLTGIVTPNSIPAALDALRADPEAVVVCGGTDVLIRIREGRLAGRSLVSIRDIPGLGDIFLEPDGTIVIGPAATFAQVTVHSLIREHLPALGHAVDQAGGPQLRNMGTIGGNVCNGATSADSASALLTLNAVLEITSLEGVRRTPLADFYAGPGRVHLAHGELLTAIRIARQDYAGFGGHYIKYSMRSAMDIATLGCAVHVKMDGRVIRELRLAFGVAAPTPIRCYKTEALLAGREADEETFRLMGETALTEVNPRTSWRASKEFRSQLVRELSRRALRQAIINGGGTPE